MNQRTAFITGANGAIGQALCAAFHESGYRVIGSDQGENTESSVNSYVAVDLARLCHDATYQSDKLNCLQEEIGDTGLHVLINNAAIQIIAPVEKLSVKDWYNSLDVNLIAPFVLTKSLLPVLQIAKGSVINVASIHAQLTKPHFTSYATSKAAMVGMTRSLAVELGSRVRVNAICPAAIFTPMLEAGFENNPQGLAELDSYHPSGSVGTTKDVTEAAIYLAEAHGNFHNGMVIGLDGGISGRLHDPG